MLSLKPRALPVLALACVAFAAPAQATLTQVFSDTKNGGLLVTGNTLGLSGAQDQSCTDFGLLLCRESCDERNAPGTHGAIRTFTSLAASAENNGECPDWPAGTTGDFLQNESNAFLDLPTGARILHAELIWGGAFQGNGDACGGNGVDLSAQLGRSVFFTTPQVSRLAVAPQRSAQVAAANGACGLYRRSADVTAEIQNLVAANVSGAVGIAVGGVVGIESSNDSQGGNTTGWSLMVAYEKASEPLRNLTIYVGAEQVASGGATQQVVTDFCTPASGSFGGRLLLVTAEGDANISGDAIELSPTDCSVPANRKKLKGSRNPVANFFASQIEDATGALDTRGTFGARNHNALTNTNVSGGRQGWDIAQIPLNDATQNPNVVAAGINGLCVRESSTQDAYFSVGLGLELDVAEPDFANIVGALTVSPSVATSVGQLIDVAVVLDNTGGENAIDTVVRLTPPAGLSYVVDSATIDGTAIAGDPAVSLPVGTVVVGTPRTLRVKARVEALSTTGYAIGATLDYFYVDCRGRRFPAQDVANVGRLETVILAVTATVDPQPPLSVNQQFTLTTTVRNNGSASTNTPVVTIAPSAGMSIRPNTTRVNNGPVADRGGTSPVVAGLQITVGAAGLSVIDVGLTVNVENGQSILVTVDVDGAGPAAPITLTVGLGVVACGDGQVAGAEQCDDRNLDSGDGCSAGCVSEPGFVCAGAPSVCTPICGDGNLRGAEECDDGDFDSGDGCSAGCVEEPGFSCTAASPSVCSTVCGDGLQRGVEQCDDANDDAGDGCAANCTVEDGFICVGIPSVCDDDVDNDGVKNNFDPDENDPDTDNDGLCDGNATVPGVCVAGEDLNGNGVLDPNETSPTLTDTDGDGLSDVVEGAPARDTDGDGTIDARDIDSDGDGVKDIDENNGDLDDDGLPDYRDDDDDGDGIATRREGVPFDPAVDEVSDGLRFGADIDRDELPNGRDTDSDGDGLADSAEGVADNDGDGIPAYLDPDDGGGADTDLDDDGVSNDQEALDGTNPRNRDSDGDGLSDGEERGSGERARDSDDDGVIDALDTDDDGDAIATAVELADGVIHGNNRDNDALPNFLDTDSDGDGILDSHELRADPDGDGIPAYLDTDSDNDGKLDSVEGEGDSDGDTVPNALDSTDTDGPGADNDGDGLSNGEEAAIGTNPDSADSDGDGLSDRFERGTGAQPLDTDGDGLIDARDTEDDNDGILTAQEIGNNAASPRDSDGDGIIDARDADDDNDGILTRIELADGLAINNNDVDGDGIANFLDTQSDGDGILDRIEGRTDTDNDGIPGYLDPNDRGNAINDRDGDGLNDADENRLGTNPDNRDTDGDGDIDGDELGPDVNNPRDTDGDTVIDALDDDDDGDGIATRNEIADGNAHGNNIDGDGVPNHRDTDSDGDGITDRVESAADADNDGIPNYLDLDSDGDGISDQDEGDRDVDGDGIADFLDNNPNDGPDADPDGDGLKNGDEQRLGTDPDNADTDGDGVNDGTEVVNVDNPADFDNDGVIDALDPNFPDGGGGDGGGDGDGEGDGLSITGGGLFSSCAASDGSSASPLIGLGLLAVLRRRRRAA